MKQVLYTRIQNSKQKTSVDADDTSTKTIGFQSSPLSQSRSPYQCPRSKMQRQLNKALDFSTGTEIDLDLSTIPMKRISSRVFNLANNLISLNISCCKLTQLSSDIGKLRALVSLDVSDNCLVKIPSEIGNLKCLKLLGINHNKIKSCPRCFSTLKIEELDVSFNRFENHHVKKKGLLSRDDGLGLFVCLLGNLFSSGFNPSCVFALYSFEGS